MKIKAGEFWEHSVFGCVLVESVLKDCNNREYYRILQYRKKDGEALDVPRRLYAMPENPGLPNGITFLSKYD